MNFEPALKPKLKMPKNSFDLPPPKFGINNQQSPSANGLPPPRFSVSTNQTPPPENFNLSDPPVKTETVVSHESPKLMGAHMDQLNKSDTSKHGKVDESTTEITRGIVLTEKCRVIKEAKQNDVSSEKLLETVYDQVDKVKKRYAVSITIVDYSSFEINLSLKGSLDSVKSAANSLFEKMDSKVLCEQFRGSGRAEKSVKRSEINKDEGRSDRKTVDRKTVDQKSISNILQIIDKRDRVKAVEHMSDEPMAWGRSSRTDEIRKTDANSKENVRNERKSSSPKIRRNTSPINFVRKKPPDARKLSPIRRNRSQDRNERLPVRKTNSPERRQVSSERRPRNLSQERRNSPKIQELRTRSPELRKRSVERRKRSPERRKRSPERENFKKSDEIKVSYRRPKNQSEHDRLKKLLLELAAIEISKKDKFLAKQAKIEL